MGLKLSPGNANGSGPALVVRTHEDSRTTACLAAAHLIHSFRFPQEHLAYNSLPDDRGWSGASIAQRLYARYRFSRSSFTCSAIVDLTVSTAVLVRITLSANGIFAAVGN